MEPAPPPDSAADASVEVDATSAVIDTRTAPGLAATSRPVSMRDVARRAGVSQKTVSRVINGEPHVRGELRERIQDAIAELGYRPNAAARSLVTRRTRRIGVAAFGAPLHGPSSVLTAVEAVARAEGYALSIQRTDTTGRDELQSAVEALLDQGVEGIVLSEPLHLDGGALEIPAHVAVLTLGSQGLTGREDELIVGADEFGAALLATGHLLSLGHRTVHHIAGPSAWVSSRQRCSGWEAALEGKGLEPPETVVGDWSPRSGFESMRLLLEQAGPTAVFVANDQMAIGAIAAVQRAGLRVPGDVSIIGFDDLDLAEYLTTPLTTMRQEFDVFAHLGMARLLRAIDGRPPSQTRQLVPASLVTRATTGPPPPIR
ncbi:LacI family DNA-binding transcriptional regulator [Brachybacterium hainanense]|uniref:LacI family DNA-binding transcriptional regulator n=1 Tax=Brachybacterium hainanense TaxID=1541174 RepID=A0ABV6R8Z5_9MICO